MSRQLRSELLKLRSTRTTLGLALGMLALVLLLVLVGGLTIDEFGLSEAKNQRTILGGGQSATLFAALVGVMIVTSEFRFGTIRSTLLVEPRRPRVIAAKLLAGLSSGVAFGIVAVGTSLGLGALVLYARGIGLALDTRELLHLALGSIAVTALWAGIGVGLGAIVRHQVGAIVGLLAWVFVAESLLFGLVPSVGRYAPGPAGQPLAGDTTAHLLTPAAGGLLLVGYTLVLAAAGALVTARRDVG